MKTLKNIPRIFLSFFAASFLMWFLINLSKEYKTEMIFEVEYDNIPQEKIFRESPVKEVRMLLIGNGFKLFTSNLFRKKVTFEVDKYKRNKTKYYLLTDEQKSFLQNQLQSGLELLDVLDDTIHLNLGTFRTKKVPVTFTNAIKFKPGYGLSNAVLTPDSVQVSGPLSYIEDLEFLPTKPVQLEEVSEDVTVKIGLEVSKDVKNVRLSTEEIEAQIIVDKFTEGTFEIPVQVINLPPNVDVKIYPKKVNVTYKVGLKNYSKITEDLFEVVCDFKASSDKGLNYLIPTFKKKSNMVSSARITPRKIDYLIQK